MYIKRLTIQNFKSVKNQTFEFTDFDLLVGINNSGKSTILQALAIWQYCVDEFHRTQRKGSSGIQIVLPNFSALPLPEFNLLWTDKTERKYPEIRGYKKQQFIYIEINLFWIKEDNSTGEFGIKMRYQSPQSVYVIPQKGWKNFKELDDNKELPHIVYVPPFSGLEPNEYWFDDGIIRKNIGKAQPGSVLRNLLYRVIDKTMNDSSGKSIPMPIKDNKDWLELKDLIKKWFGVTLNPPQYEKGISTEIKVSFASDKNKEFDIIAGGSGFHQVLTLLAFYYGYPGITTILFDEPDAHLHVNLQRQILNHFRGFKNIQLIIATHAEEFIKGVDPHSLLSVLTGVPKRIQSVPAVITALSDIDNMTIVRTSQSPYILYLEGEDDERLLNTWAKIIGKSEVLSRFYIEKMGGASKRDMKEKADKHFLGLRQIIPEVHRIMLFDYDTEETSFKDDDNPVLIEWKRKNIENYLLVPEAWKRAILEKLNIKDNNLFTNSVIQIINDFFNEQNLSLPKNFSWKNIKANIFTVVDGKKILFENQDSLFQRIKENSGLLLNREFIAMNMLNDEIHYDIVFFFEKLEKIIE